ncbi:hypothetical protein GIW70_09265 [Pseudomonas syringae]|nr:hypothetical protein [Pseudomonas syringae]MCF5068384.1 hypothetical protein [Pseudomonas syringae]
MSEISVWIDAAAIVVMPSDMANAAADDVLQSVLLAQLVASKRKQVAPELDWHDIYANVLGDYWMSSFKSRQDLPVDLDGRASPLEWVRAALAHMPGDHEQLVRGPLQGVSLLSGDLPAIGILRKHAQATVNQELLSGQSTTVRLMVIQIAGNGLMSSVCLQFETTRPVDANPWGQPFDTTQLCSRVSVRCFQAHLSETLYAPARAAIARKLEAVLNDNLANITEVLEFEAREAGL